MWIKDAVSRFIEKTCKKAANLNEDIQICITSAARHMCSKEGNGDSSLLRKLVLELPKGTRKETVKEYICWACALKWNESSQSFKADKNRISKPVAAMILKPWFEWAKEEREQFQKPLDFGKEAVKLGKKFAGAINASEVNFEEFLQEVKKAYEEELNNKKTESLTSVA